MKIDLVAEPDTTEERLENALWRLDTLQRGLDHMSQAVCVYGAQQQVVAANRLFAELYGLRQEQIVPGMTLEQICRFRIANGIFGEGDPESYIRERTAPVLANSDRTQELSDGRTILIRRRVLPNGGWVTTHEDITAYRAAQRQVTHLATHDSLTGLSNRAHFTEQLSDALRQGESDERVGLLWLDLDRFKSVNDSFGHSTGDALLRLVAKRIRSQLRQSDLVARLSGDEFVVALIPAQQAADCAMMAERIIANLSAPYSIDGAQITIGVSIGIALSDQKTNCASSLLWNADLALYRAKSQGRGVYRFFESGMDEEMRAKKQLEHALRAALTNEELELYYQPSVDLKGGRISGMEALLRWKHGERGMVSPMEFIPLAEETGLILPIGEWVLRRACRDAMNWTQPLTVAVNVSAAQFRFGDLTETVATALRETGLDPARLEIEITESVLMTDVPATLETLRGLKNLGVRIAMDDFGTGYSSLSYLNTFPFDKIKIDRSFIKDLSSQGSALTIVRSIAGLGASLGMSTTAEGVETVEQLGAVSSNGCTEVQGFYFSKPQPMSNVETVIKLCENKMREFDARQAAHASPVNWSVCALTASHNKIEHGVEAPVIAAREPH